MRFPNALAGVKKIYTAEILAIIGVICGLVSALLAFIGVSTGGDVSLTSFAGTGLLLIVMAVLSVIAFIMNIVGLNKAKVDEPNFKTALYMVLLGIVATVAASAVKNSTITPFLSAIGMVSNLLITWYVCTGIVNLAEQLGNEAIAKKGRTARAWTAAVWVISIVLSIVGNFVGGGLTALNIGAACLALASYVVQFIAYILYLSLLSKAKKMLAE